MFAIYCILESILFRAWELVYPPTLLAYCICNVAIVNLHSYHENEIVY